MDHQNSKDDIRLSPQDIESIIESFRKFFGPTDHLWIFGSRVYPQKKGGDIDLYIESQCQDVRHLMDMESKFLVDLVYKIDDQKVDVVINYGASELPIYRVARKEGIQLV